MFKQMSVIGMGLLGGSLARAMKRQGLVERVVGNGRRPDRMRYALEHGIADAVEPDFVKCVEGSDLVVLCTPVSMIPGMIRSLNGHLSSGAIVTDVGSTKTEIVRSADECLPDDVFFVGSHPMAGSEDIGIEASTPTLFENALCVLTSSARTDFHALQKVQNLWEALHCRMMILTPEQHDFYVAAASHLPHMVAVSLVRCIESIAGDHEKILPLLAGGFRDTTRIASGSPEVWRDICMANNESIVDTMKRFAGIFEEVANEIGGKDAKKIEDMLAETKRYRDEIPARGRGALVSEHEVLVDVADRPGVIGEIATLLGKDGINIRNINIQHVREMGGGSMLLVLEKEGDVSRAVERLKASGYFAKPKD